MTSRSHVKPFCWHIESAEGDEFPCVTVSGYLDESVQLDDLEAAVTGPVRFVMREVERINSVGSHRWFRFLQRIARFGQHRFIECAPSVVRLLNLIPIFQRMVVVESVMGSFVCPECDAECVSEISTTEAEIKLPETSCGECGSIMEFDETPASYFAFLRGRA